MIYYTSDLHFGHANIIRFCNRPFADVKAMDDALIAAWNERVTNSDKVYIVGDLMFRAEQPPETYLDKLKGKKYLIIGNHDKSWMNKVKLDKYFESVERIMVFANGRNKVTLCHYPMMCFEGAYLIYGHIHNNKTDNYWPLLRTMDNALNAGVEVNNYQPVTFDELIANNMVFRNG